MISYDSPLSQYGNVFTFVLFGRSMTVALGPKALAVNSPKCLLKKHTRFVRRENLLSLRLVLIRY